MADEDEVTTRLRLEGLARYVSGMRSARRENEEYGKSGDRAARGVMAFSGSLGGVLKTVGSATSGILAFGGATAGAVAPLAHLASVLGQAASAGAPLLGMLPAMAAGMKLVKGTGSLVFDGMKASLKQFEPAWKEWSKDVGEVGSKGLPDLVRGFMLVNFPTVDRNVKSIAGSMNWIVRDVGKWLNSLSGQKAVAEVTRETAGAMARVRGPLAAVVKSFGDLAGRGAAPTMDAIADATERVAGWLKRTMDGVSRGDIEGALVKAKNVAHDLGGKLRMVKDVVSWLADNTAKVKAFSDALAIGAFTGNPVAVAVGALTLLGNHWDDVKAAAAGASAEWKKATTGVTPLTRALGGINRVVGSVVRWFKDELMPALRKTGGGVMTSLRGSVKSLSKAFEDHHDLIDKVGRIFKVFGLIITDYVIPMLGEAIKLVGAVLTPIFRTLAWTIEKIVFPAVKFLVAVFLGALGVIIHAAASAFGWVPGLGPKLKAAATKFDDFKAKVNNALDGIKDHNVGVNVVTKVNGKQVSITDFGETAGVRIRTGSGTTRAFATGGYTGAGAKYEPAGIVHRGEFVFPQEATARIGVGNLSAMAGLGGYASGGLVKAPGTAAASGGRMFTVRAPEAPPAASAVGYQGGEVPIELHAHVYLDGKQITESVQRVTGDRRARL